MGRDDWFRNERWDDDIEAAFQTRLARSRTQGPQYLKIQAGYLAKDYPEQALRLIDQYFGTGDTFFTSGALHIRARALQSLGRVWEALAALKETLASEQARPSIITTARLDYLKLVALERIVSEYEEALSVASDVFEPSDLVFPISRYIWNGAQALILHELGECEKAKAFAEHAMAEAEQRSSPFRYHRALGLVSSTSDEFGRRLAALW